MYYEYFTMGELNIAAISFDLWAVYVLIYAWFIFILSSLNTNAHVVHTLKLSGFQFNHVTQLEDF